MGNFPEEGLKAEAYKINWYLITATIRSEGDFDRDTEKLEEAIRNIQDKLAPIKIRKFGHMHLGDWYTDEL